MAEWVVLQKDNISLFVTMLYTASYIQYYKAFEVENFSVSWKTTVHNSLNISISVYVALQVVLAMTNLWQCQCDDSHAIKMWQ